VGDLEAALRRGGWKAEAARTVGPYRYLVVAARP